MNTDFEYTEKDLIRMVDGFAYAYNSLANKYRSPMRTIRRGTATKRPFNNRKHINGRDNLTKKANLQSIKKWEKLILGETHQEEEK